MKDGGAAFPGFGFIPGYGNEIPMVVNGRQEWASVNQGMTLRVYIAIRAMEALIVGRLKLGPGMLPEQDEDAIAKESYSMADAMLKANDA